MAQPNGKEIIDTQPATEYSVRESARRTIGQRIEIVIRGIGDKIFAAATQQLRGKGGGIDWMSFSHGHLELQTPIKVSELEAEYPLLAHTLVQPIGVEQASRDVIDGESAITQIGYWNNSDGPYLDTRLILKGGSQNPKAERTISFIGGYFLGKCWSSEATLIVDSNQYKEQSPDDYNALLGVTKDIDKLVTGIIGEGHFNGAFSGKNTAGKNIHIE